jgi:hypothetical protein
MTCGLKIKVPIYSENSYFMMNNILHFFIAEKVGLLTERTETTETDTERLKAASEGGVPARTGDP